MQSLYLSSSLSMFDLSINQKTDGTLDNKILHTTYLREGSTGYAIVRKFHSRYADVLSKTGLIDVNDVLHEIFLSLSKTNFDDVRNLEHYIMRAIKLQCWSLLDKAIKQKAVIVAAEKDNDNSENKNITDRSAFAVQNEQLQEIEGSELLVQINLFKQRLKENEIRLLNLLIDETERSEITNLLEMNVNTLDTNIRRLRIKLADHLRSLGYYYKDLERFS